MKQYRPIEPARPENEHPYFREWRYKELLDEACTEIARWKIMYERMKQDHDCIKHTLQTLISKAQNGTLPTSLNHSRIAEAHEQQQRPVASTNDGS